MMMIIIFSCSISTSGSIIIVSIILLIIITLILVSIVVVGLNGKDIDMYKDTKDTKLSLFFKI